MGKPMIIDTGPVNLLDVAKVMKIMQDAGNEQAILVHNFHSDKPEKYNMLSIPYMKTAFECLVGFSAKDRDHKPDIMAITLGSVLIEKRLTMSRTLPGHHHIISLEPDEFKDYVKMVRQIQSAMGEWALKPSPADLVDRKKFFRHLVANQDIPAGTTLTEEMLEGKRLENGISPEYIDFFVGRKTKRLLSYNESITWDIV
jgi:sialic acid synthase SpsE